MNTGEINKLREQIATLGQSLFDRGLTMGSSGTVSYTDLTLPTNREV